MLLFMEHYQGTRQACSESENGLSRSNQEKLTNPYRRVAREQLITRPAQQEGASDRRGMMRRRFNSAIAAKHLDGPSPPIYGR